MGRAPCCDKANVKRGPWSPEEDATLINYVQTHGTGGNWISLPLKAGLRRCGKSCRLRWLNYLRPDIKRGSFTEEEDNIICSLYSKIGSRWSVIASELPGRTDNDVKNYWNTKLKKKLLAAKSNLITSNSNINIPINNPILLGSTTPSPASVTKAADSYNLSFSAMLTQSSTTTFPSLTDFGYGLTVNTQSLVMDSINHHFPLPELTEVMELGASAKNSQSVSTSQEASSVSGSPSVVLDNNYVSLPANEGGGDDGFSMDFGIGFPYYDLINGSWFQETASEVAPTSSIDAANSTYPDVNSLGVYQSVINQY